MIMMYLQQNDSQTYEILFQISDKDSVPVSDEDHEDHLDEA